MTGVYAERIPHTVKYLCQKLDKDDPWVDFIIKQKEGKVTMLPAQAMSKLEQSSSSKLSQVTLSQLLKSEEP